MPSPASRCVVPGLGREATFGGIEKMFDAGTLHILLSEDGQLATFLVWHQGAAAFSTMARTPGNRN